MSEQIHSCPSCGASGKDHGEHVGIIFDCEGGYDLIGDKCWEGVKFDMRCIVDNGLENLSPNARYSHTIQDILETMIKAYELHRDMKKRVEEGA